MSLNPLKLYGKVGSDDSSDGVVGSDDSPDGPVSMDVWLLKLLGAAEKRGPEADENPISLDPERQAYDDFSKWRADYFAADPIRRHFSDAQIGETYDKMKEAKDFELWKAGYLAEDPIRKHFNDDQLHETYHRQKNR